MFSQFSPQPGHLCLEIIRHLHKVTQLCDFKAWALSPLIKWVGASMTWWQERKPLIILNPYTNLRHSIWAQNIWRAFITIVFKEENEARGSQRQSNGRLRSLSLCPLIFVQFQEADGLPEQKQQILRWDWSEDAHRECPGDRTFSMSFAKCTCGPRR